MAIPDGRLNDVQETSEYDIAIIGAGSQGFAGDNPKFGCGFAALVSSW